MVEFCQDKDKSLSIGFRLALRFYCLKQHENSQNEFYLINQQFSDQLKLAVVKKSGFLIL
jgi:hypothetical protein